MRTTLLFFSFLASSVWCEAQTYKVFGKVTNTHLEPLPFASIEIKEIRSGTMSRENGAYEISLERGKYDLIVSMLGYKTLATTIILENNAVEKNIILEADEAQQLSEVVVKGKDLAASIIRQVVINKGEKLAAPGPYSCNIYIKAVQYDSTEKVREKRPTSDTSDVNADLKKMAFAEVALRFDYESPQRTKEERIGVTRGRKADGLFYLHSTEGDFNFYHNLLKVPAVSEVPILSPVSYSGLIAYKFRMLEVVRVNGRKNYRISVRPRPLSNATVEGEITIEDSTWAILHTKFSFPKYHLPQYDFFEVEQSYQFVGNKAWMITGQKFTYYSKSGRQKVSGQTTLSYTDFELNKVFPKKYFGDELSVTTASAYDQDSTFWQTVRSEPLTTQELRYIRYKDSIYVVTHSKSYLDSIDRVTNRFTWKKLLLNGMVLNDHTKERTWFFPPLLSVFRPFQFGGSRLGVSFMYNKTYPSKKSISIWNELSYGIRNHDVNGNIRFTKLYDPIHRSYYRITLERDFQYIFQGDAWINMLKRSNIYLNNGVGVGHNTELINGLYLFTDLNLALRRSVSGYKINAKVDSLFGDVLQDNQPLGFEPYNAVYGTVRLQYTPHQKYLREPREKIILGSAWPTFYVSWRKGIPGVWKSKVDFDYFEFGIEQEVKMGLAGIADYSIRSGSFLSKGDLRLVDYKFQRRGDPILFLNPREAFQALDSTFPVFNRFYEGHFIHNFNGAIINKVPLLKKLNLREVAGAGILVAPERDLRYVESFVGIERVFKWPFNPMSKVKLGVYMVGSASNKFNNPVQFKIGLTSWDKVKNKWY